MSKTMNLDEFLSSQSAGFRATVEAIPEKPTHVKVTPFRDDRGCGCASSFELPKEAIRSIIPTGKYHFCCGKRLEVAVVEFADNAFIPVAEIIRRIERPHQHAQAALPHDPGGARIPGEAAFQRGFGLVGRWPIPGTPCEIECIEVCTRFCGPTGWDCCQWETRCGINCNRYF